MKQDFKSFYFLDSRDKAGKGKAITLAFGEDDRQLFNTIKPITSEDFRNIIGISKLATLENRAIKVGLPISTFCLSLLRKKFNGHEKGNIRFVDPLQATFRGGIDEPFQSWYPYLEGYSPDFVKNTISRYIPKAKKILDPFAGSGTTPITAMRMGISNYYCEINPAMQFLIHSKIVAQSLSTENRNRIVDRLREIAATIKVVVTKTEPDKQLKETYEKVFRGSEYFDNKELDKILRVKKYIEKITCNEPIVGQFLTVCCLSILIPVSNLIRRGDLRFKTPDEKKKSSVDFYKELCMKIEMISNDIRQTERIETSSNLLCENAINIGNMPFLGIDAVITSPPYLNGTNYFRNTKLELWFLKCLKTNGDLASFRFKAITAGINDVINQKDAKPCLPEIEEIFNELKLKAYDVRIPNMVSAYFNDIDLAFEKITRHFSDSSKIAIDIGDSIYAGVHVPTDKIITKLLLRRNFQQIDEVVLRERVSRGGAKLHQVLLVYEYHPQMKVMCEIEWANKWVNSWIAFKKELPHQKGIYAKRNWGHPLHSICSYQGKMKPALASYLVKTFVSEGDKILDPFSGVGTIPFEAALQGISTFAFDISPTAYYITMAKLGKANQKECNKIIDDLETFIQNAINKKENIEDADKLNFNGRISNYFHEKTLQEILIARKYFKNNQPSNSSQALVYSCLLHILHGNRPYALSRRSHPITPFAPTGEFEYRELIPRLKEKVLRCFNCEYPTKYTAGNIYFQDATSWWPQEVDNLDAVITSPPFYDSTRFYLANWMRLWFCGWEKEDFTIKPLSFVDERQKTSFLIYEPILRQARERLKIGGVLVFHLGKSHKCDMGEELKRISKKWFKNADLFTESVLHCESHGIRDKGTVTDHQYLILS